MRIKRLNIVISVLALVFFCTIHLFAQDATISAISESRWHKSAVDNAFMNRVIADAAVQYKEYAPIARIAFYDIGYPKDKTEFGALNGYGIMLVCALSQDGSELPVKRAYAVANGKQYDLVRLKEVYVKNPDLASQTVKTFGQYRVDGLYLFPVHLRLQQVELFVDFTKNRTGMKLAAFDGTVPETIKHLPASKSLQGKTNEDAMRVFIKREYPGYTDR